MKLKKKIPKHHVHVPTIPLGKMPLLELNGKFNTNVPKMKMINQRESINNLKDRVQNIRHQHGVTHSRGPMRKSKDLDELKQKVQFVRGRHSRTPSNLRDSSIQKSRSLNELKESVQNTLRSNYNQRPLQVQGLGESIIS